MASRSTSGVRNQHLTDEELTEFREIFDLVDLDKGGSVSKAELKQLMNTLGLKPNQARSMSHVWSACPPRDALLRPPRPVFMLRSTDQPQEEIDTMVREIDADGNGEVSFDEFVAVMTRKVSSDYTPAQVKSAFKMFERDCPSGYVSIHTLEQALTTYGSEKLSLLDAQALLSQIEPDERGLVNYNDFVNMMTGA